jgi:toxoflavin synthase
MAMATNYDTIAGEYKVAKRQPWRTLIESYTLMGLIGDLAGKEVLDLACGEGYYTRLLRQSGAARVVGVDISSGMIDLARAQEAAQPLGIEYLVQDGRRLHLDTTFDLAVAAYLLSYARNRNELEAMCRGIARCVKPGGRFIAATANPLLDFGRLPSYRPYGFDLSAGGEIRDGTPVTMTIYLDESSVRLENYFLSAQTHEAALQAAGFGDIVWERPQLSPAVVCRDRDYWDTFLTAPPMIFIHCRM